MIYKLKGWLIHKLGGYTHREVFQKALEISEKVHIREAQTNGMQDIPDSIHGNSKNVRGDDDGRDCGKGGKGNG